MSRLLTIAHAVATHARLSPAKIGVRDSRRQLSFAEWNQRADNLARSLLGLGLCKGDRVGVLAYNCIEWMEIYVALARAGLVAVPINFRLVGVEIAYILAHSEARAVIAGHDLRDRIDAIRSDLPITPECYVQLGAPAPAGWTDYETLAAQRCSDDQFDAVHPDDTCALMYTSGTTGRPKGAVRSHAGSTLIALATALEMGFTQGDTALLVMPMCHANSLYFGMTFVHLGATCVIDDSRHFDP